MNNAVVITARMDSERLPGKALVEVAGKPNLQRIVERFSKCRNVNRVIVATTWRAADNPIVDWCEANKVESFRGSVENLAQRVWDATGYSVDRILRATCDCPFISWEITDLAFATLEANPSWEGMRVWGAADRAVSVYGSSEMPFTRAALLRMLQNPSSPSGLEHLSGLDEERTRYDVYYPVPPHHYYGKFFRPYRLELDTPADLQMLQAVYAALDDDCPSLTTVIDLLDRRPDIAGINVHVAEKTGPMSSYSPETRAVWKAHQTQRAVQWEGDWGWLTQSAPVVVPRGSTPIYCNSGKCFLGYAERAAGKGNKLVTTRSVITGRAALKCECGAGREWYDDRASA